MSRFFDLLSRIVCFDTHTWGATINGKRKCQMCGKEEFVENTCSRLQIYKDGNGVCQFVLEEVEK